MEDLNSQSSDMSWVLKPFLLENQDIEQNDKPLNPMKYLVICGSTISGIGKGSTLSAIAILLKSCGLRVTCVKVDPYLNIDAGTMSPYEHGEVFVLDDGGEVDLDLGNYERSLRLTFTKDHNITSGKVFTKVINSERKGGYLGKTVQMVPHVTDMIKGMIEKAAHEIVEKEENKVSDVCLVEIGGTVGDLESGIFFEAIRQFINDKGQENCAILLITYVPEIGSDPFEQKTKPTQFGVKEMKSLGLTPTFVVCRSTHPLEEHMKMKIAYMANLNPNNIISCFNVESIWDVPMVVASQNLHFLVMDYLKLPFRCYKIHKWLRLSEHIRKLKTATEVKIAVVGKYISTTDTYYSVMKSLQDAAFSANRKLTIVWLDCTCFSSSEDVDESDRKKQMEEFWEKIEGCSGILVPGGFGKRGVEGKIAVCRYARENLIPYLGICLGLQIAVIEFCRNVLGLEKADSLEFNEDCPDDVITTMEDTDYQTLGGTLRLGLKRTVIKDKNSLAYKIYGQSEIEERHRHRYEVNPKYVKVMEEKGFIFSGKDHNSERMTIAEIPTHPFFFASQYHPEFKTNPFHPTPVFYAFILAASKQYNKFRQFTEDRQPGVRALENEESCDIVSDNPMFNAMVQKILTYEKRIKHIIGEKKDFDVKDNNKENEMHKEIHMGMQNEIYKEYEKEEINITLIKKESENEDKDKDLAEEINKEKEIKENFKENKIIDDGKNNDEVDGINKEKDEGIEKIKDEKDNEDKYNDTIEIKEKETTENSKTENEMVNAKEVTNNEINSSTHIQTDFNAKEAKQTDLVDAKTKPTESVNTENKQIYLLKTETKQSELKTEEVKPTDLAKTEAESKQTDLVNTEKNKADIIFEEVKLTFFKETETKPTDISKSDQVSTETKKTELFQSIPIKNNENPFKYVNNSVEEKVSNKDHFRTNNACVYNIAKEDPISSGSNLVTNSQKSNIEISSTVSTSTTRIVTKNTSFNQTKMANTSQGYGSNIGAGLKFALPNDNFEYFPDTK